MTQYMLAVHMVDGETPEPKTEAEMHESFQRVSALEAEMRAADALRFSGRLTDAAQATVVSDGGTVTTDGPFAETKEHLGGFYIIEAGDAGAALVWASKTSAAIDRPIEVRPFWSPPQS